MCSIVSSAVHPLYLQKLREYFLAEWGKVDPFESTDATLVVPAPLLAFNDQELLGGLVFKSHPRPTSDIHGLWINALIVLPAQRRRGIGSLLIEAAETKARTLGLADLFVYTSIPALYRKLDWMELEHDGNHSVLRKPLHDQRSGT